MTNKQIIIMESIALMDAGILKGTGEFVKAEFVDADGQPYEKSFELPEPIHTFAAWKSMGYKIIKGSKAVAKFAVWKPCDVTVEIDGVKRTSTKLFLKQASFFSASQVEKA